MKNVYCLFAGLLLLSLTPTHVCMETIRHDLGEHIYLKHCKTCHGKKGSLTIGGATKLVKSNLSLDDRIKIISEGKGRMNPYNGLLTKKEIKAVAKFTMTLK